MLCDLGFAMQLVVVVDTEATEQMIHRQGIGRMKHIDVAQFLLDKVNSGRTG